MTDTTPKARRRFRELLLAKSPAQRLAMGCSMFDDAKQLALAGLRARNPGETPAQLKRRLFARIYAPDFSRDKLHRIADSF